LANALYFGETVKKCDAKLKGKGTARATIASKREHASSKPHCPEGDDDVVMGDASDNGARKRKRSLTKAE